MSLEERMRGKKNKNLSKIKCLNCGKVDHFSTKCLMKKKLGDKKRKCIVAGVTTSTEKDDLSSRFGSQEFSSIYYLS